MQYNTIQLIEDHDEDKTPCFPYRPYRVYEELEQVTTATFLYVPSSRNVKRGQGRGMPPCKISTRFAFFAYRFHESEPHQHHRLHLSALVSEANNPCQADWLCIAASQLPKQTVDVPLGRRQTDKR